MIDDAHLLQDRGRQLLRVIRTPSTYVPFVEGFWGQAYSSIRFGSVEQLDCQIVGIGSEFRFRLLLRQFSVSVLGERYNHIREIELPALSRLNSCNGVQQCSTGLRML